MFVCVCMIGSQREILRDLANDRLAWKDQRHEGLVGCLLADVVNN